MQVLVHGDTNTPRFWITASTQFAVSGDATAFLSSGIIVEDDAGRKAVKWVPLEATTAAEAKQELDKLCVEQSENRLRHIGRGPKVADYVRLLSLSGDTYSRNASVRMKKSGRASIEFLFINHKSRRLGLDCDESVGKLSYAVVR